MKIVDKSNDTVRFMDLKIGDVFFCNNSYYMKAVSSNVTVNTVNLTDGRLFSFALSNEVQKVNATLVIGGEE